MSTGTLGFFPSFEAGSYEDELQPFGAFDHEGEYEDQEFWSSLASIARSAAQNPALRRIGLTAARKAKSSRKWRSLPNCLLAKSALARKVSRRWAGAMTWCCGSPFSANGRMTRRAP